MTYIIKEYFSQRSGGAGYNDLKEKTYIHGSYYAFKINDPKPRDIHKASVGDRVIHHAVYRILYPYFDKKFIALNNTPFTTFNNLFSLFFHAG